MRRPPARPRQSRGFTLLEILIAVAIFVIVGALAMGGYNELVEQRAHLDGNAARTRAVQSAVQRMVQDFVSLEPRPVREPLGDSLEPALRVDDRAEERVSFTRSSWSNPAGVTRSTLQRVSYRLDEQNLRRDYWVMLDRTMSTEPVSTVLLEDVREVSFRFMDQNRSWHTQWPPLGYSAPDIGRLRPIAVEITLDLEDWGTLVRLVEVAG